MLAVYRSALPSSGGDELTRATEIAVTASLMLVSRLDERRSLAPIGANRAQNGPDIGFCVDFCELHANWDEISENAENQNSMRGRLRLI